MVSFARLLLETALPRGFIGAGDAGRLEERHIADSLRAVPPLADAAHVYDLGSGAGIPGIPLAIAMPRATFILVEPARRRAAFLELAVERLGLRNAVVAMKRVADLREASGACVARALAPLERTWTLAERLLRPGGRLVYFAGRGFATIPALPEAASVRIEPNSLLESGGPLVIITRT